MLPSHEGSAFAYSDEDEYDFRAEHRPSRRLPSDRGGAPLAASPMLAPRRHLGATASELAGGGAGARARAPASVYSATTAWSSPMTLGISDRVSPASSPLHVAARDVASASMAVDEDARSWRSRRGPHHIRLHLTPTSDGEGECASFAGELGRGVDDTDEETQSTDEAYEVTSTSERRGKPSRRGGRRSVVGAKRVEAATSTAAAAAAAGHSAPPTGARFDFAALDAVIDALGDSLLNLCTCSRVRRFRR